MAELIDGKRLSAIVREEVAAEVKALRARGVVPGLSVVLVGDDEASEIYVRNKKRTCDELGLRGEVHRLSAQTTQEALLALIRKLNVDKAVHGILVQLPLPKGLDASRIIDAIDAAKDADGIHPLNAGKLLSGEMGVIPCTPRGIMRMLEETGAGLAGKHAVVVGRSRIVGKPVSLLLQSANMTVTMCHSYTQDLGGFTRTADVLVSAVGVPGIIRGDMVKPGAIVIDVGTTRVEGKLRGDVDFEEVQKIAGYITPVPGGVGPMTIAMLMKNTVEAAKQGVGIRE